MTRFGPIALLALLIASCVEVDKIEVNLIFQDELQKVMENREKDNVDATTTKAQGRATLRPGVDIFLMQDESLPLQMDTPAIVDLYKRRKERAPKFADHFASGRLGEGGDGSLATRNEEGLDLEKKKEFRQLVGDENEDRKRLFAKIVEANESAGVSADDVKRLWIAARRKMCPKGWWLQNDKGKWKQKSTEKGQDDPKLEKDP